MCSDEAFMQLRFTPPPLRHQRTTSSVDQVQESSTISLYQHSFGYLTESALVTSFYRNPVNNIRFRHNLKIMHSPWPQYSTYLKYKPPNRKIARGSPRF